MATSQKSDNIKKSFARTAHISDCPRRFESLQRTLSQRAGKKCENHRLRRERFRFHAFDY